MAEPTEYPSLNGLYDWDGEKWDFIFGVTSGGAVTLDQMECGVHPEERGFLVYHEESALGHIDIVEYLEEKLVLEIDNMVMGIEGDRAHTVADAAPYLPALSSVAVIGMGTGNDAKAAAGLTGVTNVDVIEVNQSIVDLVPYFNTLTGLPINTLVKDAVDHFAGAEPAQYGAVFADPEDPSCPRSTALFKQETLQQIKDTLVQGGYLSFRKFFLTDENQAIFLNTLAAVFNNVVVLSDETILASDSPLSGALWVPTGAGVNTLSNTLLEDGVVAAKEAYA